LGALPAAASVILVISAGWFSQRLLARGVSSRVARGIFGGACVALGGAAMAIMPYVAGVAAKIALTTIGVALPLVIYVIGNAVVSEIAPVAQRGAMQSAPRSAPRPGSWRLISWAPSSRPRPHRSRASIPAL
jgi:MFS transporter, ACS family, D-galactonate transporter